MMNFFFIFLVLILGVVGCQYPNRTTPQSGSVLNSQTRVDVKPSIIDSSLFLENRVDNCDSAYVYMKNVISPGYPIGSDAWAGIRIKGESKEFLTRERRVGHYLTTPNRRFYISLKCLDGRSIQSVLDILVQKKYHKQIIKDLESRDPMIGNSIISVDGFCGFTMTYSKGVILEPSFLGAMIIN